MNQLVCEEVLADCRHALEFLEQETDPRKFRLFWLAGVAALRSVGHVLAKVDAGNHEALAIAATAAYARWKQDKEKHKIFWSFIDEERNTLLKEGEPGVCPLPSMLHVEADFVYECDFDIFAPMLKGPYFGEDCRDVLELAIQWWEGELASIKANAFPL
jgi:hypothetical protein